MWALVAVAVVLLMTVQEGKVDQLASKLQDALPRRLAQWARELAEAALDTAPPSIPAEKWALVLAGIMDRESGGGVYLQPRGPTGVGDGGHGRGLMQIDDRYHRDFVADERWKSPRENVIYGARLLRSYFDQAASLQNAVAAYNAGPKAFDAQDPDSFTTKGDYSADVLARAASFEEALS